MNKSLFYIVVVLYGKQPRQSTTLMSLSAMAAEEKRDLRLCIRDNSPEPFSEQQKSELNGMLANIRYEYRHNKGDNLPLSRIYNESIHELDEKEYLVLFDDDSEFTSDYFRVARASIKVHPDVHLFLPIVHYGNVLVSPAAMRYFKGHFFSSVTPGLMPCKNTSAINSGMIISAQYLKHDFEGYDEHIRFYGTDNDFMSRYTASHETMYVMDYHMRHTLNYYENDEPFTKAANRYRDQRRASFILMKRQGWFVYFLTHLYWLVFSVKYSIQKRDIRYLFLR